MRSYWWGRIDRFLFVQPRRKWCFHLCILLIIFLIDGRSETALSSRQQYALIHSSSEDGTTIEACALEGSGWAEHVEPSGYGSRVLCTDASERSGVRPTQREQCGVHGAGMQEDADVRGPTSQAHPQRVSQGRTVRGSPLEPGHRGDSRYAHDCASTVGSCDRRTPSRGHGVEGTPEDDRGERGVTRWWQGEFSCEFISERDEPAGVSPTSTPTGTTSTRRSISLTVTGISCAATTPS